MVSLTWFVAILIVAVLLLVAVLALLAGAVERTR